MKKLILLLPFLFVSCVTLTPGFYKDVQRFDVGKEYIAEIGDPVLFKEAGYFDKAIVITETPLPKKNDQKCDIVEGRVYVNRISSSGKDYYHTTLEKGDGIVIYKKNKEAKFVRELEFEYEFSEPLKYSETYYPKEGKTTLRRELIYNGKSGNTIKFTYREFSGDYARPAFTQDVQYDLNESKIIGFKGARIEIIDATNFSAKYTVIKDFDN